MTELRDLPTAAIEPNPDQPRKRFEREPLEELAASIASLGIVEPIVVTPAGPDRYRIVAGERRWRAAGIAGLATVPCLVREDLAGDREAFELSMVENVLRRDMDPMEEAHGYAKLMEMGLTLAELATRLGKREAAIKASLTLLKLEPGIADLVAKRHLSAWDGTRLATLGWNGQARALSLIQEHGLTGNERDRVIGQVWLAEREAPMFGDDEAPVADPEARSRAAALRAAMDSAMRALTRATANLAAEPDTMTIELAEAVLRAAGTVVKTTRQARAKQLVAGA